MHSEQDDLRKASNGAGRSATVGGGTFRIGSRSRKEREEGSAGIRTMEAVVCPVCHQQNQPSDAYCFECGFLLSMKFEDNSVLPSLEELAKHPHLEDALGRTYTLRPGINTLGRENTDILLPDRSVSRYHSIIVFDEERSIFSVEDSGSTNGTTLNGDPLPANKPKPLSPGDRLSFGNIVLRFVAEGMAQTNPNVPQIIRDVPLLPDLPDETTLPTGIRPEHEPGEAAARLVMVRGHGEAEYLLNQGMNTIGRHADNNICLTGDRYVSGHHAKIEVDDDLFLLLDLGSTNGTFLNGLRLTTNTAIAISDGDEVLIGGNLFEFHKLDAPSFEGSLAERTLLGAPSFEHLSAGVIGGEPPSSV